MSLPGRSAAGPSRWLAARPEAWRQQIRFGVLDLSGPYRKVFDDELDHVTQVADPGLQECLGVSRVANCLSGRQGVFEVTAGQLGHCQDERGARTADAVHGVEFGSLGMQQLPQATEAAQQPPGQIAAGAGVATAMQKHGQQLGIAPRTSLSSGRSHGASY